MTFYQEYGGAYLPLKYRGTFVTNSLFLTSGTEMGLAYISDMILTGSFMTYSYTCISGCLGPQSVCCDLVASGESYYTYTGYSSSYDCDGNVTSTGSYTRYPVSQQSGYSYTDGGAYTADSFLSTNGANEQFTYYGSYSASSSIFGSSNRSFGVNDYNSLWTFTFFEASTSASWRSEYNGSEFSYSTFFTEWESYIGATCGGTSTTFITGYTTGGYSTTGTTVINYSYASQLEAGSFETVTSVSNILSNTNGSSISVHPYTVTGRATDVDFTFVSVSTYETGNTYKTIIQQSVTGYELFSSVVSTPDRMPFGGYKNTIYVIGTCESVYSAPFTGPLGTTYLFTDIYQRINGRFTKDGAPLNISVSRDSTINIYNNTSDGTYQTFSTEEVRDVVDFYNNESNDLWSPSYKVTLSSYVTYDTINPITRGSGCIAYSNLSGNVTDHLYESYEIRVASTLNSGLYSLEYNSRASGLIGTVYAYQNDSHRTPIYEIATINQNDTLEMKKPIQIETTTSDNGVIFPFGGRNYFLPDATTVVNMPSGAYNITYNNEAFTVETPFQLTIFSSDNFSAEQLCVISIFGTEIEGNLPAAASDNEFIISNGLCSNESETNDFTNQFFDFNVNTFINRQTARTYYPNTPGILLN